MKPEDITIIIPSLSPGKHELTKRALELCLEGLRQTFSGKVIVAWNGEGTPYPQGQCGAVNRAVKETNTKWVMIWNNDMVASPGWFNAFTGAVDNFGLLVASPNLVEPRKGAPPFIEKFCGGLGTEGSEPDFNKQCFLDFCKQHKEHENRPIEYVVESGFNLPFIVRRDVWDTVGGYDEVYDPWSSNSDSDLHYKFMLSGVKPKRVRSALAYHFSNTSGTFHPDHRDAWQKNWEYFKSKWGMERASSPDIWYMDQIPYDKINFRPEWEGKYA